MGELMNIEKLLADEGYKSIIVSDKMAVYCFYTHSYFFTMDEVLFWLNN